MRFEQHWQLASGCRQVLQLLGLSDIVRDKAALLPDDAKRQELLGASTRKLEDAQWGSRVQDCALSSREACLVDTDFARLHCTCRCCCVPAACAEVPQKHRHPRSTCSMRQLASVGQSDRHLCKLLAARI